MDEQPGFFTRLGLALYERVFKAYRTTLVGIALAAAAVVVEQLQLADLPPWAGWIVGVISAALIAYRGKVAAKGAALLVLFLALPAHAQEAPEPRFGGCFGATCFAPTMNINLLAMSLKTGELTPTFDPGPGYGVTFMSDKWHRVGVSVSASFPLYDGSRRVEPAVVVSFAEFARVGVSCPTYVAGGFSENARLLLSLGVNLWSW